VSVRAYECPHCGAPFLQRPEPQANPPVAVWTIAQGVFWGGLLAAIVPGVIALLLFGGALAAVAGHRQ
jgi:hypothetical protein